MSWNYRVIEHPRNDWGELWYEVCEVYYNKDGEPMGYCRSTVGSETLDGVRENLTLLGQALSRPVLKLSDFSGVMDFDDEE